MPHVPHHQPEPIESVCVLGAGPSGLAVCKTLHEAGIPFDCFEANGSVGGIWDVEGGDRGGYRSLQTNTSKTKMAYADFPFSEDAPDFVGHAGMLDYFNAYTDHFGFRDRIRFNCPVSQVEPRAGGGWQVELQDGSRHNYSACIVATGQYGTQRWPDPGPPGRFDGQQMHAADYLDPKAPIDCEDKRVVVVGLGSSAAEIATELAGGAKGSGIAEHVTLSARSGRYVLPKTFQGQPLDANAPHPSASLPSFLTWIPEALRIRLLQGFLKSALGRIERKTGRPSKWNLPNPTFPPWAERPTLSDGFIQALEDRRIEGRPEIASFDGKTIEFVDSSVDEADLIIWATGYRPAFPFLSDAVLGCEASELKLYRRIAHPTQPGLFFIGYTRVICSLWPLSEQQSLWLAGVLKGSIALPGRARQIHQAIKVSQALPVFCNAYVLDLRRDGA